MPLAGRAQGPKSVRGQDARLIVRLAEMYRDSEMQSARLWWRKAFWPESANDALRVEAALGTPQNWWLAQVVSYWTRAAALVAQGTLGGQALLTADFSDELFEVFLQGPSVSRGPSQMHAQTWTAAQHRGTRYRRRRIAWPKRAEARSRRLSLGESQLGDFQFPAVANNCNPIANCPASTGTQYTTRARERKFPSRDRRFRRSFGFHGLLVRTRAPRGLTFSVIPSCAGVRTSRLDRSTVIFMGVRSSVRFEMSIEHHRPEKRIEIKEQRGNGRSGTSDAGNDTLPDPPVKISWRISLPCDCGLGAVWCPALQHAIPRADSVRHDCMRPSVATYCFSITSSLVIEALKLRRVPQVTCVPRLG